MRSVFLMMLAALVPLHAGDAGAAATDAEKFKSAVERKVALPFGTIAGGKFKALCVCNATNQVGVLESFNGIPNLGITCTVPTFTPAGEYQFGVACYDWTPATK